MRIVELRCGQDHPDIPGWTCRKRLTDAIEGTVEILPANGSIPPGWNRIVCDRCGASYVVGPKRKA